MCKIRSIKRRQTGGTRRKAEPACVLRKKWNYRRSYRILAHNRLNAQPFLMRKSLLFAATLALTLPVCLSAVAQTAPAARTARIARIAPSAPAEYAAPAAPEVAPQAPIVAPARAPSSDASTVTAQAATPMQGAPLLGARDALGHTALIRAVAADELATVDALLAAGADPNAADADGETPLQLALAMKAESIAVRLR